VSVSSKDALRSALARLGWRALPELKRITITPNVIRNQTIADIKCTVGAGEETASAAGHCNDRTQSLYGRVEHGRKRRGFLGVTSARRPRASNVARARELAKARRHRPSPDIAPEEVAVGPKI
jgi:hypothetical protein